MVARLSKRWKWTLGILTGVGLLSVLSLVPAPTSLLGMPTGVAHWPNWSQWAFLGYMVGVCVAGGAFGYMLLVSAQRYFSRRGWLDCQGC